MTGKRAYVLAAEVDQNDPCENQLNGLFELLTTEPAMPDSLIARLWTGLLATSPLEALAVLLSLVYVVLAVPRSRWCWIAGGFGSLIYIWLFARARLPMQSLLQVWYVGVAVFGFLRWSQEGTTRISLLSWGSHVAGIAASLLLAMAVARFLAAETRAAWPQLDASTMMLSLFASWLTARGKLENWLYWIVVDAVQAWLYAAQGLVFTAFLFLVYLVIASVGLIEWSKTYRRQTGG
jgi:nicotinamide mononucleotide transporter